MPGELTIRQYESADAEQVWSVHEAALKASPIPFVKGAGVDEDLTQISECYIESQGDFLVGVDDGEVVAIGGLQFYNEETAEIRRMRVHPDHQRKGLGQRLLEALEERARDRGCERIVLDTHEHLRAAQSLYTKHGYEQTHMETHPVTGNEIRYYQKDL